VRVLPQLLDFTRKGLEHHQAGFKLAAVARTWWTTRDAASFANGGRAGKGGPPPARRAHRSNT
jgi:hypothetical protein